MMRGREKYPCSFPVRWYYSNIFQLCLTVNIIFWARYKGEMEEYRVRKRKKIKARRSSKRIGRVSEETGSEKPGWSCLMLVICPLWLIGAGYNKIAFLPSLPGLHKHTHFNMKLTTLNVYIRARRKTRSHFSALTLSYFSCPLPSCAECLANILLTICL